jgi:serine/threonine protein phosphatase PrpC
VIYDHHGHPRRLAPSGPPVGVIPGTIWGAHTTTLAKGETLLVVSDGFLDYFPDVDTALIKAGQASATSATAGDLVENLIRFATARGLEDDVTALALRRTGP